MNDSSRPHPPSPERRTPSPHDAAQHELALRGWLGGLRPRWRPLTRPGGAAPARAPVAALLLATWLAERIAAPVGVSLVLLFVAAIVLAGAIVAVLSRPL